MWHRLLASSEADPHFAASAMQMLQATAQNLIAATAGLAGLALVVRWLAAPADPMYQVAEEARRAKEEFVANVSHELRTPLNMIIGFSEMILHAPQVYGGELPPALMADIMAIQRNSQHLARLVDDVLDLSQVEAGKMVLTKEWTALGQVIEAAALAVRALYDSKGLYLRTSVPADLPAVFCDSTRIRQVILNLLSNAGRFTERGGVEVSVTYSEREVTVCVADTGPGIAAADQERLFQPFQQLDGSLRRTHGGTGLGLSISKRFVEMHEGRMCIGAFQTFLMPYLLTNGGPMASTEFYAMNLYRQAFEFFRMGKACALAWIMAVLVAILTALLFRTSGRWVFYGGGER